MTIDVPAGAQAAAEPQPAATPRPSPLDRAFARPLVREAATPRYRPAPPDQRIPDYRIPDYRTTGPDYRTPDYRIPDYRTQHYSSSPPLSSLRSSGAEGHPSCAGHP